MSRFVLRAILVVLPAVLLAAPADLKAQDETVYSQSELDTPPKLSSAEMTSRLLQRSYPPALRNAGITGTVQVQFVVDAAGKVEPASIKVLSATAPQLADAAKSMVEEIKFKPGQIKGQAVKSVVLLPLIYK